MSFIVGERRRVWRTCDLDLMSFIGSLLVRDHIRCAWGSGGEALAARCLR
jgi:hypothetical protein